MYNTYVSVGQLNLCYAELHSKQQEVIALRRYVLLLCLGGCVQREIESLLCLTVTSLVIGLLWNNVQTICVPNLMSPQ